MDAMQVMIERRKELLSAADSAKNRKEAWLTFQKSIGMEIPWNTFKTYYKPVTETARACIAGNGEVGHQAETDRLERELKTASVRISVLESEIRNLKATAKSRKEPEAKTAPKAFQGWNVRVDKKGYHRLYRSLQGRTVSAYVGKYWNTEKASQAIQKIGGNHG